MNLVKSYLTIVILFIFMTTKAQLSGDWKGTLDLQEFQMEIIFHISSAEGSYSTTMDIPAQSAAGIPIETTQLDNDQVVISSEQFQMTYKGTLDGDGISGTFEQGEMALPLNFNRFKYKLPGDTSLPSSEEELAALTDYDKGNFKYKVEDYFLQPNASGFLLSPDGKYISYREKDSKSKQHIYVKEIATGKVTRAIEEKDELIYFYCWANNERLLYAMDQGGNENYHLYAVNLDGGNLVDLTPFEDVRVDNLYLLEDMKDYIIILMNKNNKQLFDPYKLNILTGEMEQLFENRDPENNIEDFVYDQKGELRGYKKTLNGIQSEFYYKDLLTGEFNLVKKMDWYEKFIVVRFNYLSNNKNEAYVVTNLDSDKTHIVLYDFKANKIVKELFSNPDYDLNEIRFSKKRDNEIDSYSYDGEKYTVVPVSDFYKKLDKRIKVEFGDKECHFVICDEDENTFLFLVQSDRLFGRYYLYDTKTEKFSLLYDLMPQLKEEDMAESHPIIFKSRDGLTIHGYITLPREVSEGKKVPMIVVPHGGPHESRDTWSFNPQNQLFASRGYATLEVNFRISDGYGKEFLKAGFKQVGRKMMDDIEDGVNYGIEQGWVDKDKIAIYGASHGGYASLMGLIKTPDLYACGIDYVGISNIFTLFESLPEYWKPIRDMLKEVWYDVDDPEEAKIAREVSPVYHVDKIQKPLFVIQGANDPRVNINESDQIVTALRAKGFEVPYMVKYNEGHGFRHEENQTEVYKCILGFLAKNFFGE